MQIVINVTEETYKSIKHGMRFRDDVEAIMTQIENGTPLPKGHGDLVDRSKICKAIPAEEDNCTGMGMTLEEMEAYNDGIDDMYRLVQGEPTIIEADNAESEE